VERQTIPGARGAEKVSGFYTTLMLIYKTSSGSSSKYPFLKVEEFRLRHARLANKIRTEALAGKLEADAIAMSTTYLDELRGSGAVTRMRPPLRNQLHDGFADKEGWVNGLYSTAYVLQYNTKLVKPEELPKDWYDLLDAKWKGNPPSTKEASNGLPDCRLHG
jgi:iron(III) transport system substrate-binding protein